MKPALPAAPTQLPTAQRISQLRCMILARLLDDRLGLLYTQGAIPGGSVFSGRGQEALSAALGLQLQRGDVFAPLIRDLAGRLAFGESLLEVVRCHLMRRTGRMRGRDGNIHRGDLAMGVLPMISHLGAMVSAVVGVLMARRLQGRGEGPLAVGATSIGDGGMNTGALHEGLNVAAVERVPLVLVVADNQLSYSTFSDRTYACADLADRAVGYGIGVLRCDGTDADACLATVARAVAQARAGKGPQMVVATLLRGAGHGAHDDASYVPADLRARFGDCLALAEQSLVRQGAISEADLTAWRNESTQAIADAVSEALAEPVPDPDTESWSAYASTTLATGLIDRDPGRTASPLPRTAP